MLIFPTLFFYITTNTNIQQQEYHSSTLCPQIFIIDYQRRPLDPGQYGKINLRSYHALRSCSIGHQDDLRHYSAMGGWVVCIQQPRCCLYRNHHEFNIDSYSYQKKSKVRIKLNLKLSQKKGYCCIYLTRLISM